MASPRPDRASETAPTAATVVTPGPPKPGSAPAKAALVSIAACLTFPCSPSLWREKESAVPTVDVHIHSRVIAHHRGSATIARAVTWEAPMAGPPPAPTYSPTARAGTGSGPSPRTWILIPHDGPVASSLAAGRSTNARFPPALHTDQRERPASEPPLPLGRGDVSDLGFTHRDMGHVLHLVSNREDMTQ